MFALKDAADERVRPLMGRPVQVDRETLTLRHAGGIPAPCGTSSGSATYGVDARSILLDVDRRAGSGTRRT